MKRVLLISFFSFAAFLYGSAQDRFKAGLKLGISTTQVHGDTYTGFDKAGLAGGAFVTAKINEKWSASFEMLYVQKGSKHNANPEAGDFTFYLMKLEYLEVPILFQYHLKKFTFELGPGIGYLIRSQEFDFYGPFPPAAPFQKYEASASIGVSYTFFKRLGINWRYTNSILPIRVFSNPAVAATYNPGQRNNVLAFTLNYTFGKTDGE